MNGGGATYPEAWPNRHLRKVIDLNSTETNETNETATEQAVAEHTHDHDHAHGHEHSHEPSMNPELTREIAVEVPAEEVSETYAAVTKRYQKQARIPGFRAGKVPSSLVRSKFAKELREEVLQALVSERFRKEITDQKLQPVSEPQLLDLQLMDGQPLRFKAAFEVLPVFDLAGYETVRVEKPNVDLTEEEYEGELSFVLDRVATVEPVEEDRALVDGDWAEIEFKGEVKPLVETVTEDGVTATTPAEPPVTGKDVLIEVGGKNTIPAFNEALRGAKPGQEMSFEVEYPADFGEQTLAGKSVSYDVTVKAIKKKNFPERNAELAKQLANKDSWEEFEAELRERVGARKQNSLVGNAKNKMIEEIIAKYSFPVPESFVQQRVDARLERGLRALAQQGMKPDDMRKLDFVHLRAAQRSEAEREVRATLIIDKVAEAENVVVSDEDLNQGVLMLSLQSGESYETLRGRLVEDGGIDRLREELRREKTSDLLYEKLSA
jgi:trigger factor